MKINDFMLAATRYKDLEHRGQVFEQMYIELLSVMKNYLHVYGVKCPRTFVEWAVSRRDSGYHVVYDNLTIGYTCNRRRIIAGPVRISLPQNHPDFIDGAAAKITWDDPWDSNLAFFAQDTWLIIGMDKPASESQWLTGEDFAGLTFVELER